MSEYNGFEVAVIGMAGRFPDANTIESFWKNLIGRKESVEFLSPEEYPSTIDPNSLFVPCKGCTVDDKFGFDADFFGYTPIEAEIMDPQIRLFHEIVWEAFEDSGYIPGEDNGMVGLYASGGSSFSWAHKILNSGKFMNIGMYNALQLLDKDFLATRIAYKLNLNGPAFVVQTACSSSLVAMHMAWLSLLNGECDMAVAGGIKINPDELNGFYHVDGSIASSDGHCRPFDIEANGIVDGNGGGAVILKRLQDAIKDNDNIYAIIKGSALNNDGNEKANFTSPSITGQQKVINYAQQIAEVTPESIAFIENHGTGTPLGDPIEIEALKNVFNGAPKQSIALGSLKANIGHLDAGAGVAGFIKAALAIKNRVLPPSINFTTPNPRLEIEDSPFFVAKDSIKYSESNKILRGGVSSFGMGGTNAHTILEQAPKRSNESSSRNYHLLALSAKTKPALDNYINKLGGYLVQNKDVNLADLSFTLLNGRFKFDTRWTAVISNNEEKVDFDANTNCTISKSIGKVVFMFPGQGSQYINFAKDLYYHDKYIKEEVDKYCALYKKMFSTDLLEILYPKDNSKEAETKINRTEFVQPILFIFEYVLAKWLMNFNVNPEVLIGHSLGEYTAACFAECFSPEDCLQIVGNRGRLMQQTGAGKMLSVNEKIDTIKEFITDEISLAASNSDTNLVLSGTEEAIEKLKISLDQNNIANSYLRTSSAFHSNLMEPILEEFKQIVEKITINPPKKQIVSNLTGELVRSDQITTANYWVDHLRSTVKFNEGLNTILKENNPVFIEVGPGKTLTTLLKINKNANDELVNVNTLRHPSQTINDERFILEQLGCLWQKGIEINWDKYYENENRSRISAPTYPFQHEQFVVSTDQINSNSQIVTKSVNESLGDELSFYRSVWSREEFFDRLNGVSLNKNDKVLLIRNQYISDQLINEIAAFFNNIQVINTDRKESSAFNSEYIDFNKESNIKQLLSASNEKVKHIIYCIDNVELDLSNKKVIDDYFPQWLLNTHTLIKAINGSNDTEKIGITFFTSEAFNVIGTEKCLLAGEMLSSYLKVAQQEVPKISARIIDLDSSSHHPTNFNSIIDLIVRPTENIALAFRNGSFWKENINEIAESIPNKDRSLFKNDGVYLITGGVGEIGLGIANLLADKFNATIILTTRKEFPGKNSWQQQIQSGSELATILSQIKNIEKNGGNVNVVTADASNYHEMDAVISMIENKYGEINGVFHAAGLIHDASFSLPFTGLSADNFNSQFAAKVKGTLVLHKLLENKNTDFVMLLSSLSVVLGGIGFGAYATANAFMDSLVNRKDNNESNTKWFSVNLDGWNIITSQLIQKSQRIKKSLQEITLDFFNQIFSIADLKRIIICENNLHLKIESWVKELINQDLESVSESIIETKKYPRPNITTEFKSPKSDLEKQLADILSDFLGYETVGVEDNFFDLGGDSLKAINLVNLIHKKLKKQIFVADFLINPTIKNTTKLIEEKEEESTEYELKKIEHFYFGEESNKIFGFYHPASKKKKKNIGVVICNPIWQEQVRAYRSVLLLSNELMSNGYDVLRFDYYGTGDSYGSNADISIDRWMKNIDEAILKLKDLSKIDSVILTGIRFGGTLATLYSINGKYKPNGLVLWSPIFNGKDWINKTLSNHDVWLGGSFAKNTIFSKNRKEDEANGFIISNSIRLDIEKIALSEQPIDIEKICILGNDEDVKKFYDINNTLNNKEIKLIENDSNEFWLKHDDQLDNYLQIEAEINSIQNWFANILNK